MSKKLPTWTRSRIGRNRVHWVAYDDRPGTEGSRIVDQGYSASLVEADTAARAALAAEGIYQARRMAKGFGFAARRSPESGQDSPRPSPKGERPEPRRYLYTRHEDGEGDRWVAAHLILKKTAKKVYASRNSCGPDQLGTDDETWSPNEAAIPLDRLELEQAGSVFAKGYRQSSFYTTRDAAIGEVADPGRRAFEVLQLQAPCTVDEIKAAYRLRAFDVHPDRGGKPNDFQAVEAAYRRLLREAQAPDL